MYLENNQIRRYPVLAIIAWTLVAAWMALIFYLSHQTGSQSDGLSRYLAEFLLKLLHQPASAEQIIGWDDILRSLAHGSAFFILALLTSWALTCVQVQDFRNALLALVISVLYAASDELHQIFVPGRACQLSDFLVDSAGVLLAVLLYQSVSTLRFLRADLRVKREEDLRI